MSAVGPPRAYAALGLRVYGRIDGFVTEDGTVVVTDVNGIGGHGVLEFVFQQAAMVGLDHQRLIRRLLAAACDVEVDRDRSDVPRSGSRRVHVVLGGTTSERQVSRQTGCFVGLSLLASGTDVHFHLMDLQSRYAEIGLFYVLHHDVEEIQALVSDPVRRAAIDRVARTVRGELGLIGEPGADPLAVGSPTSLAVMADDADFIFLALHGGPGEDGRLQLALDRLGRPYNGSGPVVADRAADKAATAAWVRSSGHRPAWASRPAEVDVFELGGWLDESDRPSAAADRFRQLCVELGAEALVCKPATDGCSTGVKILRRPDTMARFSPPWSPRLPSSCPMRSGPICGDGRPSSPCRCRRPSGGCSRQAFVESPPVPLPSGDLNLGSLGPWFAAKRYIELTAAVLDRPGRGLVSAMPSVTVAADELTLQQKFQQGVGTNFWRWICSSTRPWPRTSAPGSSGWPARSESRATPGSTSSGTDRTAWSTSSKSTRCAD